MQELKLDTIYNGDVLSFLSTVPDNSVDLHFTSPPYWGKRDYFANGQWGLESTVSRYLVHLIQLGREMYRTLKPTGNCIVNIDDTYWGGKGRSGGESVSKNHKRFNDGKGQIKNPIHSLGGTGILRPQDKSQKYFRKKELVGVPWMMALLYRHKIGWRIREDLIWSKPNPMPSSAKDRCTRSHEYLFHFVKDRFYYYDQKSIATDYKEKTKSTWGTVSKVTDQRGYDRAKNMRQSGTIRKPSKMGKAVKRSVWEITNPKRRGSHSATFPDELAHDVILSCCPEKGVVCDPFMGSGTTAIVAKRLGRSFIGSELNTKSIEEYQRYKKDHFQLFADVPSSEMFL